MNIDRRRFLPTVALGGFIAPAPAVSRSAETTGGRRDAEVVKA